MCWCARSSGYFGRFVSASKIPIPAANFFEQSQTSVAMALLLRRALWLRIQPKRFELPTPFPRSIAQPLDVDAAR